MTATGGICLRGLSRDGTETARRGFQARLAEMDVDRHVEMIEAEPAGIVAFRLRGDTAREWAPEGDTLGLADRLRLDVLGNAADQEREILLAMLAGPVAFDFPSLAELDSAVRVRRNIVEAARRTALAFHTTEAERPAEYWTYAKGRGFTVLPDKSLIEALRAATQPEVSGTLYSFSCYRATEYVILLAVAEELKACNPVLFEQLERQWRTRAIMSARFHDVFLREYGSMETPLPPRYYVPGDRLWFRNPDEASSEVTGYEGSWVFYLGGGLFTNFWKRDRPYTLDSKCVEIFHWRHATRRDAGGELTIDEAVVDERVGATMNDPAARQGIVRRMTRYRDPKGVYRDGGCIDTTREYPRWLCPGTSDLVLPES